MHHLGPHYFYLISDLCVTAESLCAAGCSLPRHLSMAALKECCWPQVRESLLVYIFVKPLLSQCTLSATCVHACEDNCQSSAAAYKQHLASYLYI